MTQNIAPYFVGGDPLNLYKPNQIPFESVGRDNKPTQVNSQAQFDDLVKHIKRARKSSGASDISESMIRNKLHKSARDIGLSEAEGEGFFGDIWNGIKKAGSKVAEGLGRVASNPDQLLKTISDVAPMFSGASSGAGSALSSVAPLVLP